MKLLTLLTITLFLSTAQCQIVEREEFDEAIQDMKEQFSQLETYVDTAHQKIDFLLWQIFLLQSRVEELEDKVFRVQKKYHPMYLEACYE